MSFEDHFSEQAETYSQHRPTYPDSLFQYLASLAPSPERAWDCGTGNGQAALKLAEHFRQVVATDASAEQIENAFRHERVNYRVEAAERTTIAAHSVDLITVGTAVHWFDFDAFYEEVRRVGRTGAVLAVWTYHLPTVEPAVDACLGRFYRHTLDGYWPERIRYLDERYETLPFPFEEIQPPDFHMETAWDLNNLVGFIASWSATRRYIKANGRHPLQEILAELRAGWGADDRTRTVTWPLHFRSGRVAPAGGGEAG
jgi:ubiquinone/menaquinone biosynthesis C-methylase UbiE